MSDHLDASAALTFGTARMMP